MIINGDEMTNIPMKATPFKHAVIRPGGLHDDEIHLCDTCAGADTCESNLRRNSGQKSLWHATRRVSAILECSEYEADDSSAGSGAVLRGWRHYSE